MLVLFCGPDCSGKDSVMHELAKLFNYEYYMSPRSPLCNIVYDVIYERIDTERLKTQLSLIETLLRFDAYFVYVKVKPEILEKRAIARNEKHVSNIDVFKKHIKVYKETIDKCKNKFPKFSHRFVEVNNSGDLKKAVINLKRKIEDAEFKYVQ